MRKYLCVSESCCIFASEKETNNKLNPKTRKGREIMAHRFTATAETAHMLTKTSKKEKFYFRTLTRTDHIDKVECETTEPGFKYITENDIPVTWID